MTVRSSSVFVPLSILPDAKVGDEVSFTAYGRVRCIEAELIDVTSAGDSMPRHVFSGAAVEVVVERMSFDGNV